MTDLWTESDTYLHTCMHADGLAFYGRVLMKELLGPLSIPEERSNRDRPDWQRTTWKESLIVFTCWLALTYLRSIQPHISAPFPT